MFLVACVLVWCVRGLSVVVRLVGSRWLARCVRGFAWLLCVVRSPHPPPRSGGPSVPGLVVEVLSVCVVGVEVVDE